MGCCGSTMAFEKCAGDRRFIGYIYFAAYSDDREIVFQFVLPGFLLNLFY
jgi:hypothetical protein